MRAIEPDPMMFSVSDSRIHGRSTSYCRELLPYRQHIVPTQLPNVFPLCPIMPTIRRAVSLTLSFPEPLDSSLTANFGSLPCHGKSLHPNLSLLTVLLNLLRFPGKHVLQQTSIINLSELLPCNIAQETTKSSNFHRVFCLPEPGCQNRPGSLRAEVLTGRSLGCCWSRSGCMRRSRLYQNADMQSEAVPSASAGATVCPLSRVMLELDWLHVPQRAKLAADLATAPVPLSLMLEAGCSHRRTYK
jgi:hypothetical protein